MLRQWHVEGAADECAGNERVGGRRLAGERVEEGTCLQRAWQRREACGGIYVHRYGHRQLSTCTRKEL
jgi:hypothetical protein